MQIEHYTQTKKYPTGLNGNSEIEILAYPE